MTDYQTMHNNTNALRYEGKSWRGSRIIIDAAEISPSRFEIAALQPSGKEIEIVNVATLDEARAEYARMLEYHTTGKAAGMYTRDDWHRDHTLSPAPGQEIDPEIYEEMFDCMPPIRLPKSLRQKPGVQGGFLMGEPRDSDPETGCLRYLAFTRKNGHYYYEGLFSA